MKHIPAPILLLVFLFPTLALSEEVTMDYLVVTDAIVIKNWDWLLGVGECSKVPEDYAAGSVSMPFVLDKTDHKSVEIQRRKSPEFFKEWSKIAHDDPSMGNVYRISYLGSNIDLCFDWYTYPRAVLVEQKLIDAPDESDRKAEHIIVTLLSLVNCGTRCSYGVTHTLSFSVENPEEKYFHGLKTFPGGDPFPPPAIVDQFSFNQAYAYAKHRLIRSEQASDTFLWRENWYSVEK